MKLCVKIDKMGRGYQGDPASALLDLLDPNQNNSFVDNYLDVPVDFSKTLFICTANDEGAIYGPLRDRVDIIRLSGYDIPEKIAIAKQYLIPKAMAQSGLANLPNVAINISEDAVEALVRQYCRESGVRNLERHIEMLTRKMALQIVVEYENNTITSNTVERKQDYFQAQSPESNPTLSRMPSDSKAVEEFKEYLNNIERKYNASVVTDIIPITRNTTLEQNIEYNMSIFVNKSNLIDYAGQPRFLEVAYNSSLIPFLTLYHRQLSIIVPAYQPE
jgi:ATP-dependent Lon protease